MWLCLHKSPQNIVCNYLLLWSKFSGVFNFTQKKKKKKSHFYREIIMVIGKPIWLITKRLMWHFHGVNVIDLSSKSQIIGRFREAWPEMQMAFSRLRFLYVCTLLVISSTILALCTLVLIIQKSAIWRLGKSENIGEASNWCKGWNQYYFPKETAPKDPSVLWDIL